MALIETNRNPDTRDLNIFRLVALIASTLAFGLLYSVKGTPLWWSLHDRIEACASMRGHKAYWQGGDAVRRAK